MSINCSSFSRRAIQLGNDLFTVGQGWSGHCEWRPRRSNNYTVNGGDGNDFSPICCR